MIHDILVVPDSMGSIPFNRMMMWWRWDAMMHMTMLSKASVGPHDNISLKVGRCWVGLNKLTRWIIEGLHDVSLIAISLHRLLIENMTRTVGQVLYLVTCTLSVSYIIITNAFHSLNPTICLVAIEHLVIVTRIGLQILPSK